MASITLSLIASPLLTSAVVLLGPKRRPAPAETVAEPDTDEPQTCSHQFPGPGRPGPAQDPPRPPTTTPHDHGQPAPLAPPTPPPAPSADQPQRGTALAANARSSALVARAPDLPRAADWRGCVAPPRATTAADH